MAAYDHSRVAHFIAPVGRVHDFVKVNGGHTVITKVSIVGIAAVKEIRSIRQWSYETFGDDRAVEFTVMTTPEDLKVNAEYIRMADRYVEVPGGTNNNNYANVDLIVDVAERAGVHAVWAGWGHASENPRLPESLAASKNKIVFIGPPGSAMRSLGDKISSTIVAQSAEVPTMAWSGSGISETTLSDAGYVTVPDHAYKAACVTSVEEGLERAEQVGWPIMIKASEGGFKNAYNAVVGEIPGSPIFVMKLAGQARHLEVQLLADQYGNAISLFGRDCSVQRRHQKIIEEAPVTIARPEKFEEMERAAVRLAKLVGYVSAGTVEYLYSHAEDVFYFLELNPRLQVEHPTTEMVTGVNLPAAQLLIAMGIPLHRIRTIRQLYGVGPHGASEIDFDMVKPESNQLQRKPRPKGHVVAVRITAENPDAGFKPSSGALQELNFRSSTNVWGYFSVNSAGGLHEFADSQFGHIFAYGEDRSESRKNMVVALKELSIRGDFRTTENTITTGWLDSLISSKLTAERPDSTLAVICGAVTKAHIASEACWSEYKRILDKGQVPSRDVLKTVFGVDFIYDNTRYSFTATRSSRTTWTLYLNGGHTSVGARPLGDGGLLVLLDDKSHSVYWRGEVGALRLMIDSKTCLIEQENDPTQLRSPSPGKLVRFLVDSGDHVNAGDAYAEIEVMKMYMPLVASEDGIVNFVKQPGVSLEPGDILARKPFDGLLPSFGPPGVTGNKPHQLLARYIDVLSNILEGFDNQPVMAPSLKGLTDVLKDSELPFSETTSILSTLSGRMPSKLEDLVRNAIEASKSKGPTSEFPASRLKKILDHYLQDSVRPQEPGPLFDVVERYIGGIKAHEVHVMANLLARYADTEKLFGGSIEARVLSLREQHKDDLDNVVSLVLSHIKAQSKAKLVLAILDHVKKTCLPVSNSESPLFEVTRNLAALEGRSSTQVSLKAREVLIAGQMPSYEERMIQMEAVLKASLGNTYYGESDLSQNKTPSTEILRELTDSRYTVFDVLPAFFADDDPWVTLAAFEVYIRRAYRAYTLLSIDYEEGDGTDDGEASSIVTWRFNLGQSRSPPQTPRLDRLGDSPRRHGSVSDLTYLPVRTALALGFDQVAATLPLFDEAEHHQRYGANSQPPNVLNLALRIFNTADDMSDAEWAEKIYIFVNNQKHILAQRGVRRVSVYPWYYTLREKDDVWQEEQAIRNIEPALAYQLELSRLSNYNLEPCLIESKQIHIYHGVARENQLDHRFFIRALIRPGRLRDNMNTADYLISETDRRVTSILDALEVVNVKYRNSDCNHIFMNFIYNLSVSYEDVLAAVSGFIERHGKRLWRLHVTSSEIRIALEDSEGNVTPIRCIIENVSGFIVNFHGYQEIITDKGTTILKSIGEKGPLHLQPVNQPYSTKESLQPKRYQAHLIGTTYVYDFPDLFSKALQNVWTKARSNNTSLSLPRTYLESKELVLDENDQLVELDRAPGNNNFGMVGWVFTLRTPEYPNGRSVVVVANDITYKIGSFGPTEDQFFYLVTQYARERGLPRIYLSANSGARIGLGEEALNLFSVAWIDKDHPEKGFDYLYLTQDNYLKLQEKYAGAVRTEETEDGERRHKITDIIGLQDGLGVESLKGSGLIAGETSRAYDDIFTITLVTARSVGIGAYLVRLGERAVQVEGQPIILTGAPALNKVLGREVYTSNLQLGGTQIMFKNGVSHLTASSDLEGATHILEWLSYVPAVKGGKLPIRIPVDSWDREVGYVPPKGPYDPRWLIEGKSDETTNEWLCGFFDKGSFQETLGGWAQTVVVGRARLGGIPMGVIAVETRTIERVVPADPANPASFEQRIMEAGQVWYPNSAYKTAQAIFDFNREDCHLLFLQIGQDMYDEVLKQGSKIVDGLSAYKQPVSIYIVPNGELRGGAWVVLDPSINAEGQMEMYADVEARAGVLEPEGVIEIKMRRDKITQLMERMDSPYAALKKTSNDTSKTPEERAAAVESLEKREALLQPTYRQIALLYADLHDRTGRMEAKGCAKPVVWKESRRYFYWATRARLARSNALAQLAVAGPNQSREYRERLLYELSGVNGESDHRITAERLDNLDLSSIIALLKGENVVQQLLGDRKSLIDGFVRLVDYLSEDEKVTMLAALKNTNASPGPAIARLYHRTGRAWSIYGA
ncbi:acetyl CoA carboxylase [Russula aff. rugulosa BPL654]|nr:acetyl CoA carboxylase [Russula aff. rugulosa BPL654]